MVGKIETTKIVVIADQDMIQPDMIDRNVSQYIAALSNYALPEVRNTLVPGYSDTKALPQRLALKKAIKHNVTHNT